MSEVIETLYMHPEPTDDDVSYQTVSAARVDDGVSLIMSKDYKENKYPSSFVRMWMTRDEAVEVISGLIEALRDDAKNIEY